MRKDASGAKMTAHAPPGGGPAAERAAPCAGTWRDMVPRELSGANFPDAVTLAATGCILFPAGVIAACALLPPSSPLHVNSYLLSLLGKYLCLAMLALSIDFLWGFLGVLSLGHGAFFGLGGYVMGMHLMREIGGRGVYGNPVLPDFMVFLNWQELPWFWRGSDFFPFTCLCVVLAPGLLALVFGFPAFRSRVFGVYFSIITQAMTFALMLAFFRNETGFGGNNGLTDFKSLLGLDISSPSVSAGLFAASALGLACACCLCRSIAASRLGRVCIAVRDAESRVRFTGYRVENVKLAAFVFSAILAGLAGALYVPQVGIINPGVFSPQFSVEMVVCVALGGRGKVYGAVIGALAVNFAKTWFTTALPDVWIFFLGALFVLVTLFLPEGLTGIRLPGKLPGGPGKKQRPPATTENSRKTRAAEEAKK